MTLHIGILVFPRVQQLDLTGPYEVFASLPGAAVHLIWKDRAPIVSATGLPLAATAAFDDCPPLDVLCIPGGTGVNALMQDGAVLASNTWSASPPSAGRVRGSSGPAARR